MDILFSPILKSLINLVFINLKSKKNSKTKIIFFYFPRNDLTLKDVQYIEYLFKKFNRKFTIIFGHNLKDLKKKNFYFIKEDFVPFLKNIDIFISNYICYKFPKKSKKIYLHHCIYDTPLTGRDKEKETFNSLLKYDYIFLSSQKMISSFNKYFNLNKTQKVKFLSSGYPRLDYLKKFSQPKKKNSVIIAIANSIAYPNYSIINNILSIIKIINQNFQYKIILRPHPANRKKFNKHYFPEIFEEINNNNNIEVDFNDDYLNSYNESLLMITDISGTAYTFSFLTNSPVIFFSINEKKAFKEYKSLNHFIDRKKIGEVVTNIKNLKKKINQLIKNRYFYKKKINLLKNNKLDYIGKTQDRFYYLINLILKNN